MKEELRIKEDFCISPYLHSVFGEILGTLIYDGTWVGKESEIPNINGIRKDLIDSLKEGGITAIRWPGGCAADHYHWKDGIGSDRKRRMACNGQPNDFGTDEFIELCRLVGAEPILVANVATGTPEEFADWYEYCNGDTDTKYGSLRAKNGHPEPYHVRFWGIGNTDENVWHMAFNDPRQYAQNYLRWRTAILHAEKEVKLIGLGLSERHETYGWVEEFLEYVTHGKRWKGPDFLSVHHYTGGMKSRYEKCGDAVAYSDEAYYFTLDSVKAYQADIDLHRIYIAQHANPKFPTKICFDEWGLWHPEATNEAGLRQRQTMRDALFAALSLHLFYRNSDIVEFAMETQYCNVLQSLFETDGEKFVRTPTYYAMKLLKEHLGNILCEIPGLLVLDPMMDLCSSISPDREKIVISVVNKSLSEWKTLALPSVLSDYQIVSAEQISPADVRMQNTWENPEQICIMPIEVFYRNSLKIPRHSIVRYCLKKI
ncbi:MAG: alpha-L-arabinofuranosidase C-terminal domain-containing protein [Candidatus Merdivicinus sp.]|jgi:alpha-N-arabinofuranosidase